MPSQLKLCLQIVDVKRYTVQRNEGCGHLAVSMGYRGYAEFPATLLIGQVSVAMPEAHHWLESVCSSTHLVLMQMWTLLRQHPQAVLGGAWAAVGVKETVPVPVSL